jgi:methionyl-tRNA formyltransferase
VEGNGEPGQVVSVSPLLVGTGKGLLEIKELQMENENETIAKDFAESRMFGNARFA